jgi:YVTN family beta-propeller protein
MTGENMRQKLPKLMLLLFISTANILYGCSTSGLVMEESTVEEFSQEIITAPSATPAMKDTAGINLNSSAKPVVSSSPTPVQPISTPYPLPTIIPGPVTVKSSVPLITSSPTAAPIGIAMESVNSRFSAIKSFGKKLFVADILANKLHIINTATNYIEKSIPMSSAPQSIAVKPDGTKLYVASNGSSVIDVIDLKTLQKVDTIETDDKVYDIASSNTRLYITFETWTKQPVGIDLITKEKVDTFPENVYSESVLQISKDGNTVYVGSIGGSPASLWKVDVSVEPSVLVKEDEHGSLGSNMRDMALSSDGKYMYLACGAPYYIQIIDTTTFKAAGQLPTGPYPESVDLTADGKYTFATHDTGEIKVFDNSTKTLKSNTAVAFSNYSINMATVSADGRKVYGITRLDKDTDRITQLLDISTYNTSTIQADNTIPSPVKTPALMPTPSPGPTTETTGT